MSGISYLFDPGLLELRQLMWGKSGPVKGASPGCHPVFATAIGALDYPVLRVGIGRGHMHAGFMIAGANVAPGGL